MMEELKVGENHASNSTNTSFVGLRRVMHGEWFVNKFVVRETVAVGNTCRFLEWR